MLFELAVRKTEAVEIPDLDPAVMELLRQHGATLDVWFDGVPFGGDISGNYAELWVQIDYPGDNGPEEVLESALDHEAGFCEQYYDGSSPWFQSDFEDGLEACKSWAAEMKRRYPDVVEIT